MTIITAGKYNDGIVIIADTAYFDFLFRKVYHVNKVMTIKDKPKSVVVAGTAGQVMPLTGVEGNLKPFRDAVAGSEKPTETLDQMIRESQRDYRNVNKINNRELPPGVERHLRYPNQYLFCVYHDDNLEIAYSYGLLKGIRRSDCCVIGYRINSVNAAFKAHDPRMPLDETKAVLDDAFLKAAAYAQKRTPTTPIEGYECFTVSRGGFRTLASTLSPN